MNDLTLPTHRTISDRSRGVALILASVLGVFGGHRFYVGKNVSGVLMACTLGGMGIWWLYDVIVLAAGSFRDGDDRRIVRWWEDNPLTDGDRVIGPHSEQLLDALDSLRTEVGDLNERVDFMERILAQVREPQALPSDIER
jgi:hypothetical protein